MDKVRNISRPRFPLTRAASAPAASCSRWPSTSRTFAIRDFANYYAGLAPRPSTDQSPAVSGDRLLEGQRLAAEGEPQAGIPACEACHGENRLESYPKLAGQSAAYLAGQLRLWRNGQRLEAGASAIMAPIAQRMTDEQIAAVSEFYAGESSWQAGR